MLARGQRTTEVLKQDQYQPMPVEKQITIIFAATGGFLDGVPVADCRRYEKELLGWMERNQSALLAEIREKKDIKGELSDRLRAVLTEFASVFQPSARA
jgi:F-type H+-transporting ATPase subunit alpha